MKLCFENFADDNKKICDLILDGHMMAQNGPELVII